MTVLVMFCWSTIGKHMSNISVHHSLFGGSTLTCDQTFISNKTFETPIETYVPYHSKVSGVGKVFKKLVFERSLLCSPKLHFLKKHLEMFY